MLKKPTAQIAHLVFAEANANAEKTKRAVFCNALMIKGDIVLIPFPFTDLSDSKIRPALALYVGEDDVTVSFISTKSHWKSDVDLILLPNDENG